VARVIKGISFKVGAVTFTDTAAQGNDRPQSRFVVSGVEETRVKKGKELVIQEKPWDHAISEEDACGLADWLNKSMGRDQEEDVDRDKNKR
jgi:hypothetical protein